MATLPGTDGPLAGLKVVEFGVAMAGPFCGMLLADYGASVVKVERVEGGDDSRHWPPYFHGSIGYYFAASNRNKQSIAIDLKSAAGVEVARRLIAEADVVIDNFRHGALERAGLGYEALRAENSRLIYCSISGFGASGPRRDDPANDIFMQAFSGGMSITGEADGGPVKMGISVADLGAAMFATVGILMALEARRRTGSGQRVETSLLEGQIALLSYHLTQLFASGRPPKRQGAAGQVNVPYQAFQAADDWVVIAAFNDRMWRGVCRAIERPHWADDPRFRSADRRIENRALLIGELQQIIAQQPAHVWEGRMRANGVPCTCVNRIDQIVVNEQVAARDMVVEVEAPGLGPIRMAGLPIKFERTPGQVGSVAPRLGQHSHAVLQGLGYTDEQIANLAAIGAVGMDRSA